MFLKKSKKITLLMIFALILIVIFLFYIYNLIGERVNITLINTTEANVQWDLSGKWCYVTQKEHYDDWVKKGLELPNIDFNHNFIIVSKVKLYRIYKSRFINGDCGAPDGFVIYNVFDNSHNKFFIYKMDKVWLSQMIG